MSTKKTKTTDKPKGKPRGIRPPTDYAKQLSVRLTAEHLSRLDRAVTAIGYGITRIGLLRECVVEGLEVIEARLRSEGKL